MPLGVERGPMLRLSLWFFLSLLATEALADQTLDKQTTWSGKVVLSEPVRVAEGSVLEIAPGTEIRFQGNAALTVQGRLIAKGTAQAPIRFRAMASGEAGSWPGISFIGAHEGSDLTHVQIAGAATGLTINGSKVQIKDSLLEKCIKGIFMGAEAAVEIDAVHLKEMNEVAIEASTHSRGMISNCVIESVGGAAVLAGKQTGFLVRGNRITSAKVGVLTSGDPPPIENNIITDCQNGIVITQANPGTRISGNRITKCARGISCHQFASPTIAQNTIEDCEVGIDCFQGSSPVVTRNRLAGNQRAISAIQMCNPDVTSNDLVNNDTGAYLHLSSYARFRENNFEDNRLHIALDNMSYDWEERAKEKPTRNLQMQNDSLAKQGRAMPRAMRVQVKSEGFVDARQNYWGTKTTGEMNAKGETAQITGFEDGYDVPILTYEGWPGEYKKDLVNYAAWLTKRVSGTGP